MPASKGAAESGLDRALDWAQRHGFDRSLMTGSQFAEDVRPLVVGRLQPWQRRIGDEVRRPGDTPPRTVGQTTTTTDSPRPTDPAAIEAELREAATTLDVSDKEFDRWKFKPNLTGIVVIHGIGPQLAGQTLLDWTRPIITVLGDAVAADAARAAGNDGLLAPPDPDAGGISDPVYKSNIDFSGETFPVLQVRVPRRARETPEEAAADDPLWVFTETWWASEVRPPTLRTMVGWLGEQGGVSRIVEGIQRNMFGKGRMSWLATVSVQPFVSAIVSFALLLLIAGLAITRFIPIESIRSAAALKLASTFLTDWFGGARTLLRDPAQSANVRHRLVQTIKALRAYGCQRVVVVAHSGGTIVSLTTLTDPAYPDLHIDKLITHGEALNLGWRLEATNPDDPDPVLPAGHRMLGNLAAKERLIWRDFYGTHDPASSGPPVPPEPMRSAAAGLDRFTTERTYNQMSVLGDHGGYWDNDEHFVIPLIREIDVPNGDRSASRFYSDEAESALRARRKERMSFLRLWRRGTSTLPVIAILTAAILTSGGYVNALGHGAIELFASIPVLGWLGGFGNALSDLGTADLFGQRPFDGMYSLGLLVLHVAFAFAILQAIVPSGASGLWFERPRIATMIGAIDWLLGPIALGIVALLWVVFVGVPGGFDAVVQLGKDSMILWMALGGAGVILFARVGQWLRHELRMPRKRMRLAPELVRGLAILLSAMFLGGLLVVMSAVTIGVVLLYAGSDGRSAKEVTMVREFVTGVAVVLVLFSLLQKIGTWRWNSWDIRERFALRRAPLRRPSRNWATIIGVALTVITVLGAALVALGTDEMVIVWDRTAWTMIVIGLAVGVTILSIGKDVVDNDVEVDGRLTGARAGGPSPSQVEPAPTGSAAGS